MFTATFREVLRLGKYSQWAADFTEEQIRTVLWAVGEFACRGGGFNGTHHPRQTAALEILGRMHGRNPPTFEEALKIIRDANEADR